MNERPWLKNYTTGVVSNIDVNQYTSIVEFYGELFKKYGDREAFICMGKSITYRQLDELSTLFACYVQSRGVNKGDKFAIMMPNLLQYPIAVLGLLKAGAIIVNTNPLYTGREMLHQFTDSDVKGILIVENFAAELEKILPKTNIDVIITTTIGGMLGAIKGTLVNFVVKNFRRMVPKFNLPNAVKFKDALSQGKKFQLKPVQHSQDDVIIHQYTGGTTGVAKGAMLTNRNLVANCLQVGAILAPIMKDNQQETILSPLPMYHIFAFAVNVLALQSYGSRTILVVNPRDISSIVKEFKKYPISLMTGVNTLFNAMLNNEEFCKLDFSNLKVSVAGGTALQNAVARKWEEITDSPIAEGYGMTEASPVVTVNPADGSGQIGTIGMPIPSTDVRIVDEEGNVLTDFEAVGEIQVKGPQVMLGYYNKPEETANVFQDGWLKTGDIGLIKEDGYMRIVDRKKDMILVSGFNVYPNEVEDVLQAHPKVMECAVIGQPDEKSGEAVKAFVVKKDSSLTEKELKEYCKDLLTGYKRPKFVEFRKELPKSNVGKILRRKLRETPEN